MSLSDIVRVMSYWLGMILAVASWVAGAFLLRKWHDKDFLTISKHAASSPQSYWLFVLVLAGAGGVFTSWVLEYLAPSSDLAALLGVLLLISFGLQAVTAIVPDRPGWQRTVHRWAAWSMALSWLPLLLVIVVGNDLSPLALTVTTSALVYMLVSLGLSLSSKFKRHFLFLQISYVVAFQVGLLAAVYLN